MEKEDNVVVLTDNDGKEYRFVILGFTEYGEKLYAVFTPEEEYAEENEDQEIASIVMEAFYTSDEDMTFELVDDEDLGNAVLEKFINEDREEGDN
jgi:uncharacterized protein YrzB (UPF0473 family)